jgi:hypothetical protein
MKERPMARKTDTLYGVSKDPRVDVWMVVYEGKYTKATFATREEAFAYLSGWLARDDVEGKKK